MRKLCIFVLLSFVLTGCSEKNIVEGESANIIQEESCDEHSYIEEITKRATCTETGEKKYTCEICNDMYVETLPILDNEPHNEMIYQQMLELCDSGNYIEALIMGKNLLPSQGEAKNKVNELREEIFKTQKEYLYNMLGESLASGDYKAFEVIWYYKQLIGFTGDELSEYLWMNKVIESLQGEYIDYDNPNSGNILTINGLTMIIGEQEYNIKCTMKEREFSPGVFFPAFSFEEGTIDYIRTGLVAIVYNDGKTKRYESEEGKQWTEERRLKEEQKRQEYLANEPQIGMTAEEVKNSNWGEPKKINKTTFEWGVTEQWCYPNYKYIYLDDGIVTAIQE